MVAVGDTYAHGGRISVIKWIGAGDTAQTATLVDPTTSSILWIGESTVANPNIKEDFPRGLHAPNGFRLSQISAGVVYVYLDEV